MAMRRKPLIQDERELTHATASPTLSALQEEEGVSVIIPVFNEEKGIKATLGNLHAHLATSDFNYEVIIVNDGSTDRTQRIVSQHRERGARVITTSNCGLAAARNAGLAAATGEIVTYIDDDAYPDPNRLNPARPAITRYHSGRSGSDNHFPGCG